ITSLEKQCADNAKRNEVDYGKEAELLRLKRSYTDAEGNPLIDQETFDRQLVWLIDQAVRDARLHHAGALDYRTQIKLQVLLHKVEEEVNADANEEVGDEHKPNRFDRMKNAIGEKVVEELMDKGNFHKLGLTRADIDYSTMQMQHASNEIYDA